MKETPLLVCDDKPCIDVDKSRFTVPDVKVDRNKIRAIIISEVPPNEPNDYYYKGIESLFEKTTLQAFRDAGLAVKDLDELLDKGFYFTTAVKCGKTGYLVDSVTVKKCSKLLENEIDQFPNLKAIMLMGDVAIKAFNEIARRKVGNRVIPSESTYKIRKTPYFYGEIRVFPSYLQAGPSFFIEKSKRRMIAEDIAEALKILK